MDIVEEIRKDPDSGAKRLVSEYKAGLLSLARRFCSDSSDAEELVNRTFAEVVANIERYAEQSAFFGWMCQILSNLHANDCRRKANANTIYPGNVPDVADEKAQDEILSKEDHEFLREAIEQLPKDIRKAVVMHYFMEMPVREMARVLGTPTGTIAWRLHCARDMLAAKLGVVRRKPGGKAILLALALAALTAVGAAGVAAIRYVAGHGAEEAEVVSSAEGAEGAEGALTGLTEFEEAGAMPQATNQESPPPSPEADGGSTGQVETTTAISETNSEEDTMNIQTIKSAAVKTLAAGAMLAAPLSYGAGEGWEQRIDAFAGADGWYEQRTVGTDVVLIFTNHLATSTLTVCRPVYADILTVGGGGGGGGNFGAGGGGGGVIHRQGVLLEPGEYEIAVGPGGAGNINGRGELGGTSSVARVVGDLREFVQYVPGGGGGGNYANTGGTGATGGGNGGYGTRGFGLGAQGSASQSDAAGGGSAIDIGHAATSGVGGAGGKGVYCDISGENDFYGWGGGGSSRTTAGAAGGGAGDPLGYGHGGGSDSVAADMTNGRPNHGGGGGGCRAYGACRSGGSGVVIVRWATMAAAEDGEPVIRTAGQTRIGSTSLTLAGALDDLGGAASVSVRLLYGTSPSALTGSVTLGAFTEPGAVAGTIRGLARYTDYWYCFEATGAATVRSDVRRAKTLGFAEMTWTGLAAVTTNGVYEVVSFTNGAATVTFTSPGNVDILAVGGGGSGQSSDSTRHAGGGGGGGGVLYREDLVPVMGVAYQIEVGAGGDGGNATGGTTGGDTTIMTNAVDILRAKGGGGGYINYWSNTGASGGGLGGNGNRGTSNAASAWMQGYAGKGSYETRQQEHNGGGGGGAGGDGEPDDDLKGGDGGPGVMCAITGEERYYGAGGGGGGSSNGNVYPGGAGLGGSGVGGDGGSLGDGSDDVGKPGAVNTGSGGGGGAWGSGGAGGSGIVVIRRRIADVDDPMPVVHAEMTDKGAAFVKIDVEVAETGAQGAYPSVDLQLYVVTVGEPAEYTTVATGVTAGEKRTFVVTNLVSETAYEWSVRAVNAVPLSFTTTQTFTTDGKDPAWGEKPVVETSVVANADKHSITVDYNAVWAGAGAGLVDFTLTWGTKDNPNANVTNLLVSSMGAGSITLTGLAEGTEYSLSFSAVNDRSVGDADTSTVRTQGQWVLAGQPLVVLQPGYGDDYLIVYDPLLMRGSWADDSRLYRHIFDLGTSKVLSGIRFRGRNDPVALHMENMTLWGSNTLSTDNLSGWTLVASNEFTTAEMRAMAAAGLDCVMYTYPDTSAYRYYWICNKSTYDNVYVHVTKLHLYSTNVAVRAYRPVLWSDVQTLAADPPDAGVGFDGLLTCSPTGEAEAFVAVSAVDHGNDFAAWQTGGTVTSGGVVAQGTRFTISVPGLSAGHWYSRLFVRGGDDYVASQETMDFWLGTLPVYPVGYMATANTDSMYRCYNGNASLTDGPDISESGIQMLFKVNRDGKRVTSIRFWPRIEDRTTDSSRWAKWLSRFRTMKVEVTEDEVDFSGVTVTPYENAAGRELYSLSAADGTAAAASATWTDVGVIHQLVHETYDGPIEISLSQPNVNTRIKYVRISGATKWSTAEVEFRAVRRSGCVIILR